MTLNVGGVRLTKLNKVSSTSRRTIGVVDVIRKEELVVEGEVVDALVLWLLDVSRVLLHVLHVVLGELNNEVDDVILTAKVQIDKGFLLDEKSMIDTVVVVIPLMVLALEEVFIVLKV